MTFTFDPLNQRYPSVRYPVYARRGMVNCSSPQAAAAGMEALQKGGNAVDAAVAAAAALTVAEPTANGIGGDAFALIWSEKDRKLFGLNSSGRAPALASIERVLADKKDADGKMGNNKGFLQVYGRKGLPCQKCGTELKQIKVGGRGSVYCPHCQK